MVTNILVVDDLATDRMIAGGLLEQVPEWSISYAANGQLALEEMERCEPQIVLTDLQMPELNGLELVECIKEKYPLIPVILMTSQGNEEIAVQALQAGAASYVPKRMLSRQLIDTIQRILSSLREVQIQAELLQRTNRDETMVLESDSALIASLVRHLHQSAVGFGICGPGGGMHIATALDEALTNALFHGNLELDSALREDDDTRYHALAQERLQQAPYRDRSIRVRARYSPSAFEVTITDEGPGFDPGSLPDPTDPENLCRPFGRGVMLMRSFMDDVCFNDRGNEVTIVKRRRDRESQR